VRCVFGLRLLLSFSLLSFSLYLSTLTFTLRLLTYDNISMKSCEYKFELSQQNQTVIFTFKTCTNCHSLYQQQNTNQPGQIQIELLQQPSSPLLVHPATPQERLDSRQTLDTLLNSLIRQQLLAECTETEPRLESSAAPHPLQYI